MSAYKVIYDYVNIRTSPNTNGSPVGSYSKGDKIYSVFDIFDGDDGRKWAAYKGGQTGETRYVCYRDNKNGDYTQYLAKC